MGAYTNPNGVWYPDSTDVGQPNTYLATMAQSIDSGIGARLQKQESNVGGLFNLNANQTLTASTKITVAYTVGPGGYNNGLTISGGIVTLPQKGLYAVFASFYASQQNGYIDATLMQNSTVVSETLSTTSSTGSTYISTGGISANILAAANDQISVGITFYTATSSVLVGSSGRMLNTLSIALVKPLA